MRVLVVEDDQMIGEGVRSALQQEGFAVDWIRDGAAADIALQAERYDMALLDLGLPSRDGLDVLRELRGRKDGTPVLIVTARDAVKERVAGLDAGADDYLVKPFDVEELHARVRALLRRSAGRAEPVIEHGGIAVNPATREVTRRGEPVALSARELAVLEALLMRPGNVLSRAQLEERIYGWGEEIESNAVEVYIHGLRRKLGADFIRTIRGVGYRVPKSA
ncbi:MAG TPA: response regulator [Burkholderiales bacterium]|nr:response regulator [Burkholderiales bacterium]